MFHVACPASFRLACSFALLLLSLDPTVAAAEQLKAEVPAPQRQAWWTERHERGVLQAALLLLAAATMLLGGLQMVQQSSIKRILAFSSVSQMGYVLLGLALGTPLGVAAAAMHLIHHAPVKSALFMSAGMVGWRTGIYDLHEGGDLYRRMPFTFLTMLLAGLALSGMPFFSGYISKTMLEEAALAGSFGWVPWVAVLSSALTFAGIARLIWHVFLAPAAASRRGVQEAPPFGVLLGLALTAVALLLGILPQDVVQRVAWPAALALYQRDHYIAQVIDRRPWLP